MINYLSIINIDIYDLLIILKISLYFKKFDNSQQYDRLCYDNKGKRKALRETFRGLKSEAIARENELKQIVKKGNYSDLKNYTFNDFIDKWETDEAINLAEATKQGYNYCLRKIREDLGHHRLKDLKTIHILEFYTKLRNTKKPKKLSENTILHYYVIIQRILNLAVKWEFIDSNPNNRIDRPKIIKKEAIFYDDEKIKKLLEVTNNECLKYQVIIYLALDSGARRGELTGLSWDDVDFKNKTISINKVTQNINRQIIEKSIPKNNSSIRTISLTDKTMDLLKSYKEEQDGLRNILGTKWLNSNKILIDNFGGLMHPDTPSKIFYKICKNNNLPHMKFHGLRHSSASLLISLNVHTKVISKRLGHSSSATTDMIYSHIFTRLDTEVSDKLNDIFA